MNNAPKVSGYGSFDLRILYLTLLLFIIAYRCWFGSIIFSLSTDLILFLLSILLVYFYLFHYLLSICLIASIA